MYGQREEKSKEGKKATNDWEVVFERRRRRKARREVSFCRVSWMEDIQISAHLPYSRDGEEKGEGREKAGDGMDLEGSEG